MTSKEDYWELPPKWKWASLGDIAEVARSQHEPADFDEETAYAGLEHIESETGCFSPTTIAEGQTSSKKYLFQPGSVLYGKLRPYLNKVAVAHCRGLCSTDLVPLTPSKHVSRDWLAHYLRSPEFVQRADSLSAGASLPRLAKKKLTASKVPIPPMEEQQRLTELLDRAYQVWQQSRSSTSRADEARHSVYHHYFGREDSGREGWPVSTIEDLAADVSSPLRTGPFGSALKHSEFVDKGIAVLGIDNAVQNRFAWDERRYITPAKYEGLKRYTVRPGDVIVTIMGTTGRSAVIPDDIPTAISTKHLATLTLDKSRVHPLYVATALQTDPAVLRQTTRSRRGAIMEGWNLTIIKGLEIPIPPMELQRQFVDAHRRIDRVQSSSRRSVKISHRLVRALLSKAVRGDLS